jgi:hypothetical protein
MRGDLVVLEAIEDALARRLHRVHAQVERRRLLQAFREREDLFLAHLLAQALDDPVGKVRAHAQGQGIQVLGLQRREPLLLAGAQLRFDLAQAHALQLDERGERDLARRGPRRDLLQQAAAAKRRVNRIRDERAVFLAEALVVPEELAKLRVGGRASGQDHRQGVDDRVELRAAEAHGISATKRSWRPAPP